MGGTRWLDQDELDAWRYLSSVLLLLPGHLDRALGDTGLTFFEYSMLAALSGSEDHTRRMSELAFATQGSLSRLSHAVTRLEKRGVLERVPCPDDRRVTLVRLTDSGFARLQAAAPTHVESVRRAVFDVLDEDQVDQLRGIGAALLGALRPDEAPPWEHPD